jgi:ABC-type multidrug transport system fused ATPase/permease subunit
MTAKSPKQKLSRAVFSEGLKIILKRLKPHKRAVILLIILSSVSAAAEAFIPLISGRIFDSIISLTRNPTAPLSIVFYIIAVWLALKISGDATSWRISFNRERLGTKIESEYISSGFGRLLEMPISFHKDRKRGEVSDRISRAAGWLESLVSRIMITLLPNFLSIIIALGLTFFINYKLSLVLLVAIAIYVAALWKTVPELADLQQKVHRAYNRAYGNAYDALENIQEIKQAATESEEQKKIHNNFVGKAANLWLNMAYILSKVDYFQRTLITLTQFSIFTFSVFLVRNGTLSPGELVAFNAYAAMIFGPFVILGSNWQVVQNGLVALTRAEKILTLPTEVYVPKNAVTPEKINGEIKFENVSFAYKDNPAIIKDISFRIKKGERVALVGKSGVGKTTIVDLILGFYFPQKGGIFVDGENIKEFNLTAYRSRIGVVPQEPTLFNDTIEHNIKYGNPEKSDAEFEEAMKLAHADNFIEKFPKKLKQLVGWKGIKLSIGQKQRIALARAFLRSPDILVLDEPTSALDAKSEQLIKDSLRKLMAGRTTIIIAHRLSTIREADKILVLDGGRIVEEGSHEKLLKKPDGVYRKLYEIQAGLY